MGIILFAFEAILSSGCLYVAWTILHRRFTHVYPPGPKGWPLIGNLLDMPQKNIWKTYTALREQYGEFMYMNVLGQPILVVNSFRVAQDLLEKKSAIYSDRPALPMAGEMCGYVETLPIMRYGPAFRQTRKLMHQFMGSRASVEKFVDVEEEETAKLLLRILRDPAPESLPTHIRKAAGGIILKAAYGYTTLEDNDPFVKQADIVLEQFSATTAPGAFLVDVMPWLRYLPSWLPGTGFQRFAKRCNQEMRKMMDGPMEYALRQAQNIQRETFLTMHNQSMASEEGKYIVKMTAGTLYGGGADTTVSATYALFLVLALFPEVQNKAQAEVDRVVGGSRLPALSDRANLPYIDALTKELFRWNATVPTGLPHRLIEDDEYRGYFIPKGTIVIPNAYCMLHDEETYHNPTMFNPDRFLPEDGTAPEQDPRTIAFGFGRRICPGQYVADTSTFLACAMVTAVLDVSKTVKNGVVVEPVYEMVGATIAHPKEFQCAIKPRSARAADLVQSFVKLNA